MTTTTINDLLGTDLGIRTAATYRYDVLADTWECSDALAELYGYRPGTVTLTSEVLLAHRHPDDRSDAVAILRLMKTAPGPVLHSHRIIRADGRLRTLAVILNRELDDSGRLVRVYGTCLDVDDLPGAARGRTAQEQEILGLQQKITQLELAIRSRDVIGQAKGMIMLASRKTADEAFTTLVRLSQATNVKLRDLAAEVVGSLSSDPRVAADLTARLNSSDDVT